MKYTNKHELPEIVERWLTFDQYDYHPGIYSATRLMKPTRMVVLEKLHEDELECDITDVIASRYGTALHDSFEKVDIPDCVQEVRFFAELDGHKLSGKPDILEVVNSAFDLWDIKSTSVWTHIYGSRKDDYIKQCSIYRWIIMNGKPEKDLGEVPSTVRRKGKIIYLFTDWSKSRARQGGDYPPTRVLVDDVEMMSTEEIEAYILGRLGAIHHYLDNPDQRLPPCTREELWQGDDKWAVMKEGRKSAMKVYDNQEDAETNVVVDLEGTAGKRYYVEHRPGKVNRCNYCNVNKWCGQFKELQEAGLIAE